MTLLLPQTKISDVILRNLSLIPVINRFGIRLGAAEKSIQQLCTEQQLDVDFVLAILNTHLYEDYFPEKKMLSFRLPDMLDYLTKTNNYYVKYLIPNIEHHLIPLLHSCGPENKTPGAVHALFAKVKKHLTERTETENSVLFPALQKRYLRNVTSHTPESHSDNPQEEWPALQAKQLCPDRKSDAEALEETLFDLKNILIRHISGTFNDNLAHATVFSLDSLEEDLRQQNRIRARIFCPMVARIIETE
ncbi:MAG: helix-turn-helix transcriptional regulator [Bacteroidales bacterium]